MPYGLRIEVIEKDRKKLSLKANDRERRIDRMFEVFEPNVTPTVMNKELSIYCGGGWRRWTMLVYGWQERVPEMTNHRLDRPGPEVSTEDACNLDAVALKDYHNLFACERKR